MLFTFELANYTCIVYYSFESIIISKWKLIDLNRMSYILCPTKSWIWVLKWLEIATTFINNNRNNYWWIRMCQVLLHDLPINESATFRVDDLKTNTSHVSLWNQFNEKKKSWKNKPLTDVEFGGISNSSTADTKAIIKIQNFAKNMVFFRNSIFSLFWCECDEFE